MAPRTLNRPPHCISVLEVQDSEDFGWFSESEGGVFGESDEVSAMRGRVRMKQIPKSRQPVKEQVLFTHTIIGPAHILGNTRWALSGLLSLVIGHQPIPDLDKAAGIIHDHLIVG